MTTRLHGLPAAHPFRTGVAAQMSPHALADLAVANRRGWSGPIGMRMEDDPDDDDDPDTADDEVIKIDGKEWTVGELKKIAAREKRQGKASGQREVLEALGVDDLDAAKDLVKTAREAKQKDESEAERKQREAEEARTAADRERATAAEERRTAALERALVRRGVDEDDLDDAVTILAKKVAKDADAEAIAEEADALKARRPELFGEGETKTPPPPRKRSGDLPPGKPGRKKGEPAAFGAGGLARAQRRFGDKANVPASS